jgi:hypothetical protein
MKKRGYSIAAAALALMAPLGAASAAENPVPLPALTAQWWQWAVSIPVDQNPQSDPTGQDCMVGQRGDLWFLAGVFAGGSVTRSCSIPEGKTLFFPIINEIDLNAPNVCGDGPENDSVTDLRQATKAFIDAVPLSSVKGQIDGKPVTFRRIQSQVFALALPDDNEFDAACVAAGLGHVPAGIYSPAVDDGFYVAVAPLPPTRPGEQPHTIHFHAEQPTLPAATDVTYKITVVPVLLK